MLQSFLFQIKDHRRAQGKRYQQGHVLLFSIMAILSGATSYRRICQFIVGHYRILNEQFFLNWKRMPAYTTIRDIIQHTSSEELEQCFRLYSGELAGQKGDEAVGKRVISFDGKVLRGSFNHFQDQKAAQVLTAFLQDEQIILAHEEIETKTNEIPTVQKLIQELGLSGDIFTMDALHCQKKQ